MSAKFWAQYSIKNQQPVVKETPASLVSKLRAGRVNVSKMSQPELASHMLDESKLLANIREASGLPAIRPTPDQMVNNDFNLTDTVITPPDGSFVNRRKL